MKKEVEYIIAKRTLDFLLTALEELAGKVGLSVAHHGALDAIAKIKRSLREHTAESPEERSYPVDDAVIKEVQKTEEKEEDQS